MNENNFEYFFTKSQTNTIYDKAAELVDLTVEDLVGLPDGSDVVLVDDSFLRMTGSEDLLYPFTNEGQRYSVALAIVKNAVTKRAFGV